jgi:hypothetical protein
MTYEEIFIVGWNLNLLMFVLNFFLAIKAISSKTKDQLTQENKILFELKQELDKYYPNRKYETMLTYLIPYTAFFRMSYRIIEMSMFFTKNTDTTMFDYMIYKYKNDIRLAENKYK